MSGFRKTPTLQNNFCATVTALKGSVINGRAGTLEYLLVLFLQDIAVGEQQYVIFNKLTNFKKILSKGEGTMEEKFTNLTGEQFRQYLDKRNEKYFQLVDVRQPNEYTEGHIPGANLLPLSDLMEKLSELSKDRDLLFYCGSGKRSMIALTMVMEEMEEEGILGPLYNLDGGMLSWEGKRLQNFPKIHIFDDAKSAADLLFAAMELEKGAWKFYEHILSFPEVDPVRSTLEKLSWAETAHAKLFYSRWSKLVDDPPAFETLYKKLKGDILEGGEKLDDVIAQLKEVSDRRLLTIVEFALHIEYSAFDLYRTVAEKSTDEDIKAAFLEISQIEKRHMISLINILDKSV